MRRFKCDEACNKKKKKHTTQAAGVPAHERLSLPPPPSGSIARMRKHCGCVVSSRVLRAPRAATDMKHLLIMPPSAGGGGALFSCCDTCSSRQQAMRPDVRTCETLPTAGIQRRSGGYHATARVAKRRGRALPAAPSPAPLLLALALHSIVSRARAILCRAVFAVCLHSAARVTFSALRCTRGERKPAACQESLALCAAWAPSPTSGTRFLPPGTRCIILHFRSLRKVVRV